MKIIIVVHEIATLSRIAEFDEELRLLLNKYQDVVSSISKEW